MGSSAFQFQTVLLVLALGAVMGACGSKDLTGGGTPTVNLDTAVMPLQVQQASVTIGSFQTYQITPTGGVAPYHYHVQAGGGYVDYSQGLFQAPGTSCTCVVNVSDSSGLSTQVSISVIGSAVTSPSPTPSPTANVTNCSAMLSGVNVAAVDTSSTGVGNAIGATNVNDPSSCASWCGMQRAGYCLWSPSSSGSAGSTANPICIAWPAGITINIYKTTWNDYSGNCT